MLRDQLTILHSKETIEPDSPGIVSKIEERAIISDVNINPGKSRLDSEVIAINTFRDPSPGGSGISGSIPITLAEPILSMARNKLNGTDTPSSDLLPMFRRILFPLKV